MSKTIFVHDWIYHLWGAEKVFGDIITHFINNDIYTNDDIKKSDYIIYTLFSDKDSLEIKLDSEVRLKKDIKNPSMIDLLNEENKNAISKLESDDIDDERSKKYTSNTIKIPIKTVLPRWLFGIFKYFEKKHVPIISKIFDYRNLMFFYPILIWILRYKIRSTNPTKIITSSFAVAKNTYATQYRKDNDIYTMLYLHSPYMFLWNHFDKNKEKLDKFIGFFYKWARKIQIKWDLKDIYVDDIKYNSFYTKSLIDKIYYGKIIKSGDQYDKNNIRYPKVDEKYININIENNKIKDNKSDYYIYIWRIVRFSKELDKIVGLFNDNGKNLYIVWSGPDEEYLKSISLENIKYLGYIKDVDKKIELMKWARWCINLTLESFGLINMESLLCGTPLFWYDKWGTREIIWDDINIIWDEVGYLIKNLDKENLIREFEIFENNIDRGYYDHNKLRKHALGMINKYCNR